MRELIVQLRKLLIIMDIHFKNNKIVILNNEGRIQNKTEKYTLKLNDSISAYDLYVSWKSKGWI